MIGVLLWAATFIDRRVRGYARTAAIAPEELDADPAEDASGAHSDGIGRS